MTTVQGLLIRKFAVAIAAVPTLSPQHIYFAADMAVKTPRLSLLPYPFNWTAFPSEARWAGNWANTTWSTTSTSDLPGTIVDVSWPETLTHLASAPAGMRVTTGKSPRG